MVIFILDRIRQFTKIKASNHTNYSLYDCHNCAFLHCSTPCSKHRPVAMLAYVGLYVVEINVNNRTDKHVFFVFISCIGAVNHCQPRLEHSRINFSETLGGALLRWKHPSLTLALACPLLKAHTRLHTWKKSTLSLPTARTRRSSARTFWRAQSWRSAWISRLSWFRV